MSDILVNLLNLINKEYSINEISETLNLTNKELYYYLTILKNKGFEFKRKYYYTGDIVYLPCNTVNEQDKQNSVNIYTSEEDKEFKALLISDLHLCNNLERINYLDIIFNYCRKENINIIICGGDFIDGLLTGSGKKKINSGIEQIEYAIKKYPFDKNILTFTILGNHDISILEKTGQDLSKALNNYRHDIIPIGYGKGVINVKSDSIILRHKLTSSYKVPNPEIIPPALVIQGHSHGTKIKMTHTDLCMITIPTCSDIMTQEFVPGAIKMTLYFNKGIFETGLFEELIFDNNKLKRVNEIELCLLRNKLIPTRVRLEETRVKKLILKGSLPNIVCNQK